MEPVWRQAAGQPEPGEHLAVCLQADRHKSAAGNACVRWTFQVGDFELAWVTVQRRKETGQAAQALGLPKAFRLSEAAGKQCRLTLAKDGSYMKVTGARSL
jgi:hypothetical protein